MLLLFYYKSKQVPSLQQVMPIILILFQNNNYEYISQDIVHK